MSDSHTRSKSRRRAAFLQTLIMALLSGLLSTLLWTVASDLLSGPAPALAQTGNPEQATPTQEIRYVQISVEVFLDIVGVGGYDCPGCNGVLDAGDRTAQTTAPSVEIVVRDGTTGLEIARQRTETAPGSPVGRTFFSVPERELLVVELVQIPAGTILCPNSPRSRVIRPAVVGYGVINQTFTFWQGCPAVSAAATTATPVPVETVGPPPTNTPVLTNTPVPTQTPLPPTLTPTPRPFPTEEPKPTAITIALQPPTPTSPPPPTEPPPAAEPTEPAAPTPTPELATNTPVSEEPTVSPGEPTPVPTEVPGPAIEPSTPVEPTVASSASPPSPDHGPAVRALSIATDQQDLQRAIAKALSERQAGTEALDEQTLTQVLARAVEIRVEEKTDEVRLAYERSLQHERRQGMLMAFFTGVAGVFTASFWKALAKVLLTVAGKGIAAASPGLGTTLLLAVAPLAGLNRRQCGNCRHYQASAMRGQGWCRNPRLYAPHVRHLVHASDLDCARSHLPDLWESLEAVEERVEVTSAGHQ